jgi:hypothetical protein
MFTHSPRFIHFCLLSVCLYRNISNYNSCYRDFQLNQEIAMCLFIAHKKKILISPSKNIIQKHFWKYFLSLWKRVSVTSLPTLCPFLGDFASFNYFLFWVTLFCRYNFSGTTGLIDKHLYNKSSKLPPSNTSRNIIPW